MQSLYYKYDLSVEHAYILTIKGHKNSEEMSRRCQQSCERVGMKYKVWNAFDGTQPGDIKVPEQLQNESFFNLIKITNHYLTKAEVATCLSHLSLWYECARIDKPIMILEHDAVLLRKFEQKESLNSIVYLGGVEWQKKGWKIYPIPPHGTDGPNYHFLLRAHAYVVDPQVAKNLVAHFLRYGINTSADCVMRADLFNITHQGLYAYDESGETSIPNRNIINHDLRNDNLKT